MVCKEFSGCGKFKFCILEHSESFFFFFNIFDPQLVESMCAEPAG